MIIPDLRPMPRVDETREFAYQGRAYRLRSPGQLSISTPLPDGRQLGLSWSYQGAQTGLHVRLGGNAPFGRDGEYLGLFTRIEDLPPVLQETASAAIAAAAWYVGRHGSKP